MTSFASTSLKLLRRLLHSAPDQASLPAGESMVLDGISAVVATEALCAQGAGLGATYPASIGARLWHQRSALHDLNQFAQPLAEVPAHNSRAALAGALGLSMSGLRATAFLSGPDFLTVQDLLAHAVGRHLPLVVHLTCRSETGQAQALGTGHRAYHAAADLGLFQLFAMNAQEAVDFALIARRVAERTLVPGLVAMDAEQTAVAAQDVIFPSRELIEQFLGDPTRSESTPTKAQRLIFGDDRRRVPNTFDLDQPALLSPLQGSESFALGAAGQRAYFHGSVSATLGKAFAEFALLTGRSYGVLEAPSEAKADLVLVAQGSAVETLRAFTKNGRTSRGESIKVVGLRALRPWPTEAVQHALGGAKVVAVLERVDAPLAADGPLLRELKASMGSVKDSPKFVGVPYGIGGLPLNGADLQALVTEVSAPARSLYYLGLDFVRTHSAFPKYQAMMDALRRSDESLAELGVCGTGPGAELRPEGAVTMAVHRQSGAAHESLAGDAVTLLHRLIGGHVRSRPGITWERYDAPCRDVVTMSGQPLLDPGDDVPIDLAIVAADRIDDRMRLTERLAPGSQVLLAVDVIDDSTIIDSSPSIRRSLVEGRHEVYVVRLQASEGCHEPWRQTEALLGGLLALFLKKHGKITITLKKALDAREAQLSQIDEAERTKRLEVFTMGFESVRKIALSESGTEDTSSEAMTIAPRSSAVAMSRTWDHAGVFYRTGRTDELTANPALAEGTLPALSSTMRDVSRARKILPVFDPAACDGDPRLWTTCPDGSMLPLVIAPKTLIDAGIELAGQRGTPADALRGIAGKLVKRIIKIVKKSAEAPTMAGPLLREAFEAVSAKMDKTEDRYAALVTALDGVVEAVGELPVAKTKYFFDEPENETPGSGELFSLVVNPEACKCPELIIARGEGLGIKAVHQDAEQLKQREGFIGSGGNCPTHRAS